MDPRRSLVVLLPPTSPSAGGRPSPSIAAALDESGPLPPPVRALMGDFRILVNECLREMLATRVTSRMAVSRHARTRALETRVTGTIGLAAADVARSLASGHRRRLHQGIRCRVPFVRTPFVRVPAQSFHFDLDTGRLRISLRRGEWTSIVVPLSNHHRRVLIDPSHRVTQVHIGLRSVIFVYAKKVPKPYPPTSLVALDTNESSLDGVQVDPESANFVRLVFPELRELQFRHMGRRRYLGKKKAHDRRLSRWLLGQEGRRERNRIH